MVIFGFMLNYALRVNLTIAIVAMVEEPAGKGAAKVTAATAVAAPLHHQNDTFVYTIHSANELSSAAHTLPISTSSPPESFQNATDKVSASPKMYYWFYVSIDSTHKICEHERKSERMEGRNGKGQKPEFNALCLMWITSSASSHIQYAFGNMKPQQKWNREKLYRQQPVKYRVIYCISTQFRQIKETKKNIQMCEP